MVIDFFPQEIWNNISSFLLTEDLFNLRLVSKCVDEKVKYHTIWKFRCEKQWLEHQSHDVLNQKEFFEDQKLIDTRENNNWIHYYRYRSRIDSSVIKQLHQLVNVYDNAEYWKIFSNILRMKRELIIPILHSIVSSDFNDDMVLTTIAGDLLTTIRHKHLFELLNIENSVKKARHLNDTPMELLFLEMATVDPSFDRLLKYREKVQNQVHDILHQKFELDSFLQLPSTIRVDKITRVLYDVLNLQKWASNPTWGDRLYTEDFLLLRIYAGEVKGYPLIILSIIQSLAAVYNIDTELSCVYLIIKDHKLRNGESYLTISPKGIPKIFLKQHLIRTLGESNYHDFIKPLTNGDVIRLTFNELADTKKSRWSIVKYDSQCSLIRQRDMIYPYSKLPIMHTAVGPYSLVHSVRHTELSSRFNKMINNSIITSIQQNFPGDSIYLDREFPNVSYEEWLLHKYSISMTKNQTRTNQIGKFMLTRNGELVCIAGVKEEALNSKRFYYTVINSIGEYTVELEGNLTKFEWDRSEVELFLSLNIPTRVLGRIFGSINWEAHQLTVNQRIQHIITST